MRIGVDFDNTLVCYDGLFFQAAVERQLVPASLPPDKLSVRDYLRAAGQEDRWIELQGYVYGERIEEARPFAGALEFLSHCRQRNVDVYIISHRTRRPYLGPDCDLHAAARRWLISHRVCDRNGAGIDPSRIFFDETREQKLARIAETKCSHFVDDLAEFLTDVAFPPNVNRILFDPNGNQRGTQQPAVLDCAGSWREIESLVFGREA